MKRPERGRALFYTRDSGGQHETTPAEYVAWAQRKAEELGLSFAGTGGQIEAMICENTPAQGDLFQDWVVSGNQLSRRGLDALLSEAKDDSDVSHVLIPRRDRLARPDDPTDGIQIENSLRRSGITIVFMNRVCAPLERGERQGLADLIVATLDYDQAGEYRRDLAQKVLHGQLALAKGGFSTGGRAPYGFRRWLAKDDGTRVRELVPGERVRMKGHHVVWLPGPEEELAVIRRLLEMLETMPATRVAAKLTAEGVPTPDHDRYRTDNGVRHRTSGVWHQTTIVNIARNPLLAAVCSYGRRSMGDQLRFTPEGPRNLDDSDFRHDEKPKVVRNPESGRVTAPAHFKPLVAPERHEGLLKKLDERGGKQRGKPRSRDPNRNPLGCRIYDMNCGWPMYRQPNGQSFRYLCGSYQQSHGQKCDHNHVNGPLASRFVLSCLRQRLLSFRPQEKLLAKLRKLAEREQATPQPMADIERKQRSLDGVKSDLEKVTRNMALAANEDQHAAMARVFDELKAKETALSKEIRDTEAKIATVVDVEEEVQAAVGLLEALTELAANPDDLCAARGAFDLANAKLFLRFQAQQLKKRSVNKISGGVVTFGEAPPPIETYRGPTAREKIKRPSALVAEESGKDGKALPPESCVSSGREGKSLGNVSRGDWI